MHKNRLPAHIMAPIRKEVLARDEKACIKCQRTEELEVHHIIALTDGGTNDLDNLITLCHGCHLEWGTVECLSTLTFDKWLDIPPYTYLLAFYLKDFETSHARARHICDMMFSDDKDSRKTPIEAKNHNGAEQEEN